jgi:hypothetical protein
VQHPSGWIK